MEAIAKVKIIPSGEEFSLIINEKMEISEKKAKLIFLKGYGAWTIFNKSHAVNILIYDTKKKECLHELFTRSALTLWIKNGFWIEPAEYTPDAINIMVQCRGDLYHKPLEKICCV